jgi:hypothetical protein
MPLPELNMKKKNINNDFFARKNNNNKTQRGCEMNQLEMTVDESLQSKH